ncbi:LOW QUALITY PROTEIN: hypothetical protein OSB04_009179 [Centaurea solstitialis]|uniref:Cytochrome P450 n=1 Tax=Centaurea solstitialis TaxID=347529 RepID=A0AA38WTK9_9ASTR|nr:LOW QUALITY PROTEIN: hypothetical protein OSB04_009179 [Centaurea solstitialis]
MSIGHRLHMEGFKPGLGTRTNLLLLTNSSRSKLEPIVKNLNSKYGPIITLSIASHPFIFVADPSLAHQFLIKSGTVFSDRPTTIGQRSISSASYVVPPPPQSSHGDSSSLPREVILVGAKMGASRSYRSSPGGRGKGCQGGGSFSVHHVLLVGEIAKVQRDMLLIVGSGQNAVITLFPKLGKILFRKRWNEFEKMLQEKERVLSPLIKCRIEASNSVSQLGTKKIVAYVDTLMNLRLLREEESETTVGNGGRLTEKEMMVGMCSEFLNAGTDTTSTVLQWIMANLVKHPHIQSLRGSSTTKSCGTTASAAATRGAESTISEEDMQKMAYLKVVVLEGLRRRPPVHFVLPHRVMKEVEVEGRVIPEDAAVNFYVAEMGWNPKVWDDPTEFKPERFLMNDGFDISGSKGIKMMPFGAGRRICPGSDLVVLHLEYFVANLIWVFRWDAVDGYGVDLSKKPEFTTVMKNPLQT